MKHSKNPKLQTLLSKASALNKAWEDRERTSQAIKSGLRLEDWIEITGIVPTGDNGSFGMYFISPDAISFKGWNAEHINASPVYDQPDMHRQNQHRLVFPCTPQELVNFIDSDVSGDLFDSLTDDFRASVARLPTTSGTMSDAALGSATRKKLRDLAFKSHEEQDARHDEHLRWQSAGDEIKKARSRPISKRQLAKLVQEKLSLPDSIETIRKYL